MVYKVGLSIPGERRRYGRDRHHVLGYGAAAAPAPHPYPYGPACSAPHPYRALLAVPLTPYRTLLAVSWVFRALYAKCPDNVMRYMQSVRLVMII